MTNLVFPDSEIEFSTGLRRRGLVSIPLKFSENFSIREESTSAEGG